MYQDLFFLLSHVLYGDPLGRFRDLGQKIDEVFFVHLAAVVGKGVKTPLHAEGKQDAPLGVGGKGRVLRGQPLPQPLFDAVGEDALPRTGEQDVHGLPVLDKGPEQVAGQRLGLGHGQLHSQNAGQDVLNELFLQLVGQRVDILVVGVEGGFVHARQRTEILDLDLFQRRFCPQLQKGLFDGTVGFFDADVQK